jgi:O-antigen/teichoic acid export membrane protein
VWATALSLAGYAIAHAVRGVLGGMGKFAYYGAGAAIDGVVRVVGAAWVGAAAGAAGYAWVLFAAPILAAVSAAVPLIGAYTGSKAVGTQEISLWRGLVRNTGLLMLAGLIAQVMANIAVVNAKLLSPGDVRVAVALLGAMVIVRIPIVVFGSMYSAMLNSVSTSVANGDATGFRQTVQRTLVVVTVLAGLVTLACLVAGPQISVLMFNSPGVLTRVDFLILCAGTAAYLWAMVLGQSLLAMGGHARQAVRWALGLAALALVTALPLPVTPRVELAYLAGMALTAGLLLHATLRGVAALAHKTHPAPGGAPAYDAAV